MNKLFFIFLFVATIAAGQAPDLERVLMLVKMPYPQIDTLDRLAARLHYFDQNKPSPEQQQKLIEIYKSIANGYSVNYHFKQGYIAYEKYLLMKEKNLAGEKTR